MLQREIFSFALFFFIKLEKKSWFHFIPVFFHGSITTILFDLVDMLVYLIPLGLTLTHIYILSTVLSSSDVPFTCHSKLCYKTVL